MRSLAIYVAFFASLVVPPLLTWQLWRLRSARVLGLGLWLGLLSASMALIALAANWSLVGIWFMPVWIAAFALVAAARAATMLRAPLEGIGRPFSIGRHAALALAFAGIASVVASAIFTGPYVGEPVRLQFPLEDEAGQAGGWYVGQGGRSLLVNAHHAARAQTYALDILGLNALGMRAAGILPRRLSDYAIYDRVVVSPCAGEVLAARDSAEEFSPPTSDPDSLAGNHVTVACQGATVLLAHLRPGSARVAVGDDVDAGDPVGRVGNSGNTTEPHLHIHAVDGRVLDLDELVATGVPRPLQFEWGYLHKHSSSAWLDRPRL